MSILILAQKNLTQMFRDRKVFLFLLIMPIAFTLMFGFAFSGSGSASADSRLPVGLVNNDGESMLSSELVQSLDSSTVIRLVSDDEAALQDQLAKKELSAVLVIPAGFGDALESENPQTLTVWADTSLSDGYSAKNEIDVYVSRLNNAAGTAKVLAPQGGTAFNEVLSDALEAWQTPPVSINASTAVASDQVEESENKFNHSSPGMMLQFAVAGLLTCAMVVVTERKTRCLQRLLTTSTNRVQILFGHYLAIFSMLLIQFFILLIFGDLVLKLNYFSQPLATLLITITSALCISALGLLIGVLAKAEEQAISFSLICMFVLSGLGGAWVPLEYTGKTFQTIGHITPIAWAMDGFKNILSRGLGLEAAWLPALALLGYAVLFFALAGWKFKSE